MMTGANGSAGWFTVGHGGRAGAIFVPAQLGHRLRYARCGLGCQAWRGLVLDAAGQHEGDDGDGQKREGRFMASLAFVNEAPRVLLTQGGAAALILDNSHLNPYSRVPASMLRMDAVHTAADFRMLLVLWPATGWSGSAALKLWKFLRVSGPSCRWTG